MIGQGAFGYVTYVYKAPMLTGEIVAVNSLATDTKQGEKEFETEAAMNTEGGSGWEEIIDSQLEGNFDELESDEVASLAYKCINRVPQKRPSMRDIVQVLSRIQKCRHNRKPFEISLTTTEEEVTIDINEAEAGGRTSVYELRRQDSTDSVGIDF